ncbi:hypothetical protein SUDANB6_01219 [Streptomyces sp. enrichment culture]
MPSERAGQIHRCRTTSGAAAGVPRTPCAADGEGPGTFAEVQAHSGQDAETLTEREGHACLPSANRERIRRVPRLDASMAQPRQPRRIVTRKAVPRPGTGLRPGGASDRAGVLRPGARVPAPAVPAPCRPEAPGRSRAARRRPASGDGRARRAVRGGDPQRPGGDGLPRRGRCAGLAGRRGGGGTRTAAGAPRPSGGPAPACTALRGHRVTVPCGARCRPGVHGRTAEPAGWEPSRPGAITGATGPAGADGRTAGSAGWAPRRGGSGRCGPGHDRTAPMY